MPASVGGLVLVVLQVVGLWLVFEKAGRSGWQALVPLYNLFVLVDILDRSDWWVLWLLIPVVGFVFWFLLCDDLANAFGYGTAMTLALFLVPVLALPWLGLGSHKFSAPTPATIGEIRF